MSGRNDITAYPLAGYSTLKLKKKGVLVLEMKLIGLHPVLGQSVQSLHFQMTAQQARGLVEALAAAAVASEMKNSRSDTRN